MNIFDKYPKVKSKFDKLAQTRQDEILSNMLASDDDYIKFVNKRADASMTLKNAISGLKEASILFEQYSDAIYAQETYELAEIYRLSFIDAIIVFQENDLIYLPES